MLAAEIDELCAPLFALLPRKDQRRAAELYVRGLLGVEGRRSIRNIAALTGGSAVEQSLHHFVAKSTWDWRPLLAALTRRLAGELGPSALVLAPMVVEKEGDQSVGVTSNVVSCLGRSLNHQHAMSLWLSDGVRGFPVGWRLALPDRWEDDADLRRKVGVPGHLANASITDCAIGLAEQARVDRPVVVSAPHLEVPAMLAAFDRRSIPFLLRVNGGFRVGPAGAAAGHLGAGPRPARHLADRFSGLRRAAGPALALRLPVTAGPLALDLVAIWTDPDAAPGLWLTNLDAEPGRLAALAGYPALVRREFREVTAAVGAVDFEGRSYQGWHHHTALVSLAHAVVRLGSDPVGQPGELCVAQDELGCLDVVL